MSEIKEQQSQSQSQLQSQSLKRVLSIQSHVVQGYVGNKCATFPLQVLGYEVDAIFSVQFSNHTGYANVKGQVLTDKELVDLIDGLESNDLLKLYSHLLTGYIGNASFLKQVAVIVSKLRKANPNLIYVCDPVLGDNGKMYVPRELLEIYKLEIINLADVITPNQYEVELLTNIAIKDEGDIWKAIHVFHQMGVDIVVISSTDLKPQANFSTGLEHDQLKAFISKRNGPRYVLNIPKLGLNNMSFTGTGDLFAALFLAHSYQIDGNHLNNALERTVATLQAVIQRTLNGMPEAVKNGSRSPTALERELKIIQSKGDIENPKIILKSVEIK